MALCVVKACRQVAVMSSRKTRQKEDFIFPPVALASEHPRGRAVDYLFMSTACWLRLQPATAGPPFPVWEANGLCFPPRNGHVH